MTEDLLKNYITEITNFWCMRGNKNHAFQGIKVSFNIFDFWKVHVYTS